MLNTSVVEALKAADLYKETGRIMEQMLVTILPNGERREHKMAEIDNADIKIFADELDIALTLQNPLVQSLYAKNAAALVSLIRVINTESASGFKGSVGSGRQLDALIFRAEQFTDPDIVADTPRASWARAISGAGEEEQFIVSGGAAVGSKVALTMEDEEGIAIVGFVNPATSPVVDAVEITYLSQDYNIQNLDFELANPFIGDAIVELKQPLFIFPKESALVKVRYFAGGDDNLRPIGLWIKMSSDLRALETS